MMRQRICDVIVRPRMKRKVDLKKKNSNEQTIRGEEGALCL